MGNNVAKGLIEIGTLSFYISNLFGLKERFGGALFMLNNIINDSKYLSTIFEFLDIKQKIVSPKNAIKEISTPPAIEFKNVNFAYPGTDDYVLKDFNLKIEAGQKIAIVGENGAGKSTIIKLILRFYDVTNGEIQINGVNIKDLDIDVWRSICGVLLQDFVNFWLFNVEENIGFGSIKSFENSYTADETNEKVVQSSKDARAHDFIMKNTKGYKEAMGRSFDGVDFSGGEHQRIAIARTFFRDAGLVIMDEPTSAVDAKAESEIFESMKEHLNNKTVIFVSHRFSTVRIADRIVIVNEGKIIEDGSHSDLMEIDGLYKKMFTLQRKGYE